MGCGVSGLADEVHPAQQTLVHDIPELIRADEADEVVLVRHYQRTVHGIHPFDGGLHRPAAIQHAGCRIDPIDALRRYGGLRKGGEILYFCKEVEVGHAIAPPNGLRFALNYLYRVFLVIDSLVIYLSYTVNVN